MHPRFPRPLPSPDQAASPALGLRRGMRAMWLPRVPVTALKFFILFKQVSYIFILHRLRGQPSQKAPWGGGLNHPFGGHSAPPLPGPQACLGKAFPHWHLDLCPWACLAGQTVPQGPTVALLNGVGSEPQTHIEHRLYARLQHAGMGSVEGVCWWALRAAWEGVLEEALLAEGSPSLGRASTSMTGPGEEEGVTRALGCLACCCGKGSFK